MEEEEHFPPESPPENEPTETQPTTAGAAGATGTAAEGAAAGDAEPTEEVPIDEDASLGETMLSMNFLVSTFWFSILSIRISSFYGWFDKWLESKKFDEDTQNDMLLLSSVFATLSMVLGPIPKLLLGIS